MRSSVRMANANEREEERRCKATNRHGQRCRVTKGLGADGLCVMHSGKVDPREMGRKGGSRGKGNAQRRGAIEKTPELRSVLRTMDPHVVKAGLEEILAGNNAGAKVSAIKLLADLELFKAGGEEDWRREMAASMAAAAAEFDRKFAYRLERHRLKTDQLVGCCPFGQLSRLPGKSKLRVCREMHWPTRRVDTRTRIAISHSGATGRASNEDDRRKRGRSSLL
jgi:hypothetical protein